MRKLATRKLRVEFCNWGKGMREILWELPVGLQQERVGVALLIARAEQTVRPESQGWE